ncbi:WXG100 family type VII secretion target [Xylanimonas allomyrinae]|uniref:WXG100 family type VII secretion target n=1 Tax=Xylanimonas allomyrinae TaxID=2509459 RepID=UPI0013A61F85|nr:WXG100 family type VII secretion target [Xylanimonas allomyrinae]
MSTTFHAQPDELERWAGTLGGAARAITDPLNALDRAAQTLRRDWSGAARLAFDDAQRQRLTGTAGLTQLAQDSSRSPDAAAQRCRAAEQAHAHRWPLG